jgi:hypothetical protein
MVPEEVIRNPPGNRLFVIFFLMFALSMNQGLLPYCLGWATVTAEISQ